MIGDIDEVGAKETAERIRADGGEATVAPYDASDEASCVALVERAVEAGGQLDLLANIAGISAFYRLDEISSAVFQRFLSVNLVSPVVLCREGAQLYARLVTPWDRRLDPRQLLSFARDWSTTSDSRAPHRIRLEEAHP